MYKLPIAEKVVIPAKAGIHYFQYLLDPPVKPEDDRKRLYTQTLFTFCHSERSEESIRGLRIDVTRSNLVSMESLRDAYSDIMDQ